MGKVVHGDRELKTLHRPARFAGAAVLQAGVEHQAVDRLPSRQQVCCATLDAGEISQVADRRRQPARRGLLRRGLLRQWRQHLAEASGAGGIAAGHGEAVAGRQQPHGGLQTDARVATGD